MAILFSQRKEQFEKENNLNLFIHIVFSKANSYASKGREVADGVR